MIRRDLAFGALAMTLVCASACGGSSSKSEDTAAARGKGGSGGVGDSGVGGSRDTGDHAGVAGSAVGVADDANAGVGGETPASGGGGGTWFGCAHDRQVSNSAPRSSPSHSSTSSFPEKRRSLGNSYLEARHEHLVAMAILDLRRVCR
jgi:hypothetical protein